MNFMMQGNIFNIQRYTIHDGPGIRTELFLKGCPLSCTWCGNPESRKAEIEPGVYAAKCIGRNTCGRCADVCPNGDALVFGDGTPGASEKSKALRKRLTAIDRSLCINCMACALSCPADAVKQWGKRMTVDEVMDIVRRDISYYESSGGGVTISGGEPLMQADFTVEIFKKCRQEKIHTCLESTFCMDWRIIENVIPHADMLITDIKHMDSEMHRKYTGVFNERILENLRRLSKLAKPIIVRIPVIPEVNDDMENMAATADFILNEMKNHVQTLQLLGFMRLGEEKYASLGMSYDMKDVTVDRTRFHERIKEYALYFNGRGIRCIAGTHTIKEEGAEHE